MKLALGVVIGGLALDGIHYLQLTYTTEHDTPHRADTQTRQLEQMPPRPAPITIPPTGKDARDLHPEPQERINGWPGPPKRIDVPTAEEVDRWIANHTPR
jgi:hypothetical protein